MAAGNPPAPPLAAEDFSVPALESDISLEHGPRASTTSTRSTRMAAHSMMKDMTTHGGIARRTFGIILLLTTVFLWTVSNFLASVSVKYNSWYTGTDVEHRLSLRIIHSLSRFS